MMRHAISKFLPYWSQRARSRASQLHSASSLQLDCNMFRNHKGTTCTITSNASTSFSQIVLGRKVNSKDHNSIRKFHDIHDDTTTKIKMSDYTYDLKHESIAQYPADPRGSSRLLRVDHDGDVTHFQNFSESIISLLGDAHLVFNESKVVNARLNVYESKDNNNIPMEMMILDIGDGLDKLGHGLQVTVMIRKEGVELGDVFTEESSDMKIKFRVEDVIGPWIEDEHSNGNGTECTVECILEDRKDGDTTTFASILDKVGTVPIPPYLGRDAEPSDESAYNNVYASITGSVAAPTAGLHFTDELLQKIGPENISNLSLHVGAGTFKPVVVEDAYDHSMHGEDFIVNVGEIRRISNTLKNGRRMVVVGTTSSRTLESLYWCGVKILLDQDKTEKKIDTSYDKMTLGQHEWSQLAQDSNEMLYTPSDALQAVIGDKDDHETVQGRTSLMIAPGSYEFKIVNELITNFHAPDSTLMLLVSAFLGSGHKVRIIYQEAQKLGYRFLSYGDVCFFSRPRI